MTEKVLILSAFAGAGHLRAADAVAAAYRQARPDAVVQHIDTLANPIPGQEERNADHFLEEGVAIRCNNLPALAFKIDRLLDDPPRLAAMRAASRKLSRPGAAAEIVRVVRGMTGV